MGYYVLLNLTYSGIERCIVMISTWTKSRCYFPTNFWPKLVEIRMTMAMYSRGPEERFRIKWGKSTVWSINGVLGYLYFFWEIYSFFGKSIPIDCFWHKTIKRYRFPKTSLTIHTKFLIKNIYLKFHVFIRLFTNPSYEKSKVLPSIFMKFWTRNNVNRLDLFTSQDLYSSGTRATGSIKLQILWTG